MACFRIWYFLTGIVTTVAKTEGKQFETPKVLMRIVTTTREPVGVRFRRSLYKSPVLCKIAKKPQRKAIWRVLDYNVFAFSVLLVWGTLHSTKTAFRRV